jgi:hypothetical protein
MEILPDEPAAQPTQAPASSPAGQTRSDRQRWQTTRDATAAIAFAAAYLVFQLALSRLKISNAVAFYTAALISLSITLCITVTLARALRSIGSQVLCLGLTSMVTLPFVLLPFLPMTSHQQLVTARRVYGVYVMVFQAVPGLRGLLLIVLATGLGVILSQLVREIKILLPVAVVLAVVDLYVVFGGGLVTQANSGKAPAAQAAMRSLTVGITPRLPANVVSPPPLAVGFADFLFIALFFAAFARFGIPAGRTFALLCGILCLYMLAVIIGHLDLPALLPIACVVIGGNMRAFHYKREEAFAMLYAGLIVLGILGVLMFASHRR